MEIGLWNFTSVHVKTKRNYCIQVAYDGFEPEEGTGIQVEVEINGCKVHDGWNNNDWKTIFGWSGRGFQKYSNLEQIRNTSNQDSGRESSLPDSTIARSPRLGNHGRKHTLLLHR